MNYTDYLKLDTLLNAQELESSKSGPPARDELLFIIIHQTYELWFKQILHEIDICEEIFTGQLVDDAQTAPAAHALERIVAILKVLVQQIDVLETMTPLDFLDFRDLLVPASGFQSAQFRQIETRLGLKREDRLTFDGRPFETKLKPAEQKQIANIEAGASLADLIEKWLERTPFVAMEDYTFAAAYASALQDMFANERRIVEANTFITDAEKKTQLEALKTSEAALHTIIERDAETGKTHKELGWRFSREALSAALFINLYRDEPALQIPFRILQLLMDMDELLCQWRYRHALMVERMIGRKVGTGGSSGFNYLRRTADEHRIFNDLFALSTYLIPRSALPILPEKVQAAMRYRYEQDG